LTRLVTDALHSRCTCLFLPSEDRTSFELFHCEGLEQQLQTHSLRSDSPLVRWLESHQEILTCSSLDIEPGLQGLSNRERRLLDAIGARLIVPIATPRDGTLAGLLVLGPKGATGDYSGEDRRLLDALRTQLAISLENARLYSDALRARRDLERWLDGMDDSVIIFGPDKHIRFANKSAQDTLQLRPGDPCHKVLGSNECRNDCDVVRCAQRANTTLQLPTNAGDRQYDVVTAQMTDPDGRSSILSVLRDVTEGRRFEEELRRSRERMRELAAHLESAREQERAGIARELHDELGQLLTALKMDLAWFSQHEQQLPEEAHSKVSSMMDMVDTTIGTVQRISSELRPGILDDLGLSAALEWLARGFKEKSGIPCDVDLDETIELDSRASTALFRICQESLTNVARHSDASRTKVSLKRQGHFVALTISDNGRGVTTEETERTTSFGFIGMRERARGLGGQLTVSGSRGEGTTITVSLPLQN
ncbi:MAG: GAF domain-containing sensor histidine kinase, partial [Chloroflexota bacterium]